MAYSRWGSSNWYTFWSVSSLGEGEGKDDQMLSVWFSGAEDLLNLRFEQFGAGTEADIEAMVQHTVQHYERQGCTVDAPDVAQLREDLKSWVEDVEADFDPERRHDEGLVGPTQVGEASES